MFLAGCPPCIWFLMFVRVATALLGAAKWMQHLWAPVMFPATAMMLIQVLSVVVVRLGMAQPVAVPMGARVPSVVSHLKLGLALPVAVPMAARVPSVVSHLKLGMVRLAALLEAMALRVPSVLAVKFGLTRLVPAHGYPTSSDN